MDERTGGTPIPRSDLSLALLVRSRLSDMLKGAVDLPQRLSNFGFENSVAIGATHSPIDVKVAPCRSAGWAYVEFV